MLHAALCCTLVTYIEYWVWIVDFMKPQGGNKLGHNFILGKYHWAAFYRTICEGIMPLISIRNNRVQLSSPSSFTIFENGSSMFQKY